MNSKAGNVGNVRACSQAGRQRILDRAEDTCERCGVDNYAELISVKIKVNGKFISFWVSGESDARRLAMVSMQSVTKSIKVVLTIAHLDHDEENHDVKDDRLKAMCQFCHLNYDLPEKMRRQFKLRG